MSLQNLDNLVKTGQLKIEEFNQTEFNGLMHSGKTRLKDANNATLAGESRFDLAYNAAHSIALAALRWHGYRSVNRYLVFQVLPYTHLKLIRKHGVSWQNVMIYTTSQNMRGILKLTNNFYVTC